MFVRRKTYNKVKEERDEALVKVYKLEAVVKNLKSQFSKLKDVQEKAEDLVSDIVDLLKSSDQPTTNAMELKKDHEEALKKLEEKLKEIPDGARGTGGIDIINNGNVETKNFSTKKELEEIYKDAKKGNITLASQDW